jgi:hypothetical protein
MWFKVNKMIEIMHETILVTPKNQLLNAGAANVEDFGFNIVDRLNDSTCLWKDSLFRKSFVTDTLATEFQQHAAESVPVESATVLPPILLRSEESVVFKIPNMYLVCHKNGPIIPVVFSQLDDTVKDCILFLYTLSSNSYLNRHNFEDILQHNHRL